jgi:diamine N-acetyltransferase
MLRIRAATRADAALIVDLIRELAVYERLEHEARATPKDIERELSAANPVIHVLIAEWNGEPAGFALYFYNFSTFVGRRGIYLEDLFVRPALRAHGIGKALLAELARIAHEQRCGRVEWAVLNWNEPAIGFYRKIGARPMDEWTVYRLTPPAIETLSAQSPRIPSSE